MTYRNGHKIHGTEEGYAQHLTPEAATWIAERHDPKFKPKKGNPKFRKLPKMSEEKFNRVMLDNLLNWGTPRQIAEWRESH